MAPPAPASRTVAKLLARRLGYRLLDTGAIYRAVALDGAARGHRVERRGAAAPRSRASSTSGSTSSATRTTCSSRGEDVTAAIRTPEISQGASQVSAHPAVRAALLELQRRLGAGGGVVVEGRDTGTVVFPDAEAKFFLTATDEERARRRVAELRRAGTAGRLRRDPARDPGARPARRRAATSRR